MAGLGVAGEVKASAGDASATAEKEASIGARPRLYFSAADVAEMRKRFESVEKLNDAKAKLLEDAEADLKAELVTEDYAAGGAGQHGNYYAAARSASRAIETCAFAWVITGDERFAMRAREGLRHFAQYKSWTGRQFDTRDPAWHSALETAHFTRAYALGIDWLADALPSDERRAACDALARLGVEPIVRDWLDPKQRIHALDSMGHNWWMVCVGAAGVGAITLLGEDNRAEEWLRMVVDSVPEFLAYPGNVLQNKPRSFDPDGGFYESLNYADYTLRYYAYLTAALQHAFPKGLRGHRFDKLQPQLDGMFKFMHYFLYPRRGSECVTDPDTDYLSVAFGDDGRHTIFSGDVTLFLARATGDGRYRWYFDRYSKDVRGFYQMIFYDPQTLPKSKSPEGLPLSRALEGIGWASLRDSWKDNATFLAVKCGDTWNHAHADAGSFVVYAGGEPLLIDPGSCSYGRPEYRRYYTESIAHNVVLFNGEGQARSDGYRGTKFPGRLHSFLDAPGARYLLADATGPFANVYKRYLRHFLWMDDMIVLVDDLLAHKAGRFEWLFHGETPPRFEDGRMTVDVGKARLEMDVLFPQNPGVEQREGLATKDPDRKLNYLALTEDRGKDNAKFIAVMQAGRQIAPLKLTGRENDEWLEGRIRSDRCRYDLYCNLRADGRRMHNNSNLQMGPWETDAFLLCVRTGETPCIVIIGGSYLRSVDDQVLFACLSKCNAVLNIGVDRIVDDIEVYVQAPEGSRVRVANKTVPKRAVLNGKTVSRDAIAQDGKFVVIR